MTLSKAPNSSLFFISTKNLCLYSSSPTSSLELPEVLNRKLLRHLFSFPSITIIIGQNPLGEWENPCETIGNIIIGMRCQSLIKEEPIWHKFITF